MLIVSLSVHFLTLTLMFSLSSADISVECRPEKISNAIHKMAKVSSDISKMKKCRKINFLLETIVESDCPGQMKSILKRHLAKQLGLTKSPVILDCHSREMNRRGKRNLKRKERCENADRQRELMRSATDCYRNELALASTRVTEARLHSDREQLLQEASCILAANLIHVCDEMLCIDDSSEENELDQKNVLQTYIQEYFHSFDIKKCNTFR